MDNYSSDEDIDFAIYQRRHAQIDRRPQEVRNTRSLIQFPCNLHLFQNVVKIKKNTVLYWSHIK